MSEPSVTYTKGSEWWIDRLTTSGRRRYPKRILVGELGREHVYLPEDSVAPLRCADCAHCKQVRGGSGVWCELWRHRTRADGYCHMGEELRKTDDDIGSEANR